MTASWGSIVQLLASLRRNRRLVSEFVRRDLRGRYAGASLGFFWSVIFPLVNLVLYTFVFRFVLNTRWSDQMGSKEVVLVMLTGIVIWSAFAETLGRSTTTMIENSNLIQKVVFPAEVLPAFLSLSSLFNMTLGMPIVLIGMAYVRYATGYHADYMEVMAGHPDKVGPMLSFGWSLFLLPLLYALQFVFMTGLGFLCSTANVLVRDLQHVIGVGITVWMWATPIFYPADLVRRGGFGFLLELNPMYWLLDSYHKVLLYGRWPDPLLMLRFSAVALLVFCLGAVFLMRQKPRFPDLL